MSSKQKKLKFKPRIKLNYNIYISLFSGPIGKKLRICSHKWIEINDIKYESASMYIWTLWSSFSRIFAVVFCC